MFELSGAGVGAVGEGAGEEGGSERVGNTTPIYPKLTGVEKAVKSERDVARRMLLDVVDERRE
jgi:hypothetical protein